MAQKLFTKIFDDLIKDDLQWAVFSGLFVFCYISFHVESIFMAGLAMMSIMLSFPVTYVFYTGVF